MGMAEVVSFPMNDANLLRIVQKLAQNTLNVRLQQHAKQRMRERNFSMTQIYACLRRGCVYEPAHRDVRGNWKLTLVHRQSGDEIHVCAALKKDTNGEWVAVITVF
jgi:hypothetical protein